MYAVGQPLERTLQVMGVSVMRHLQMTRDDMIWGGTRLLGAWVGILAFRQALSLATGVPSLFVAVQLLPDLMSGLDSGDTSAAASAVIQALASNALSQLVQCVGLSGLCWYLLSRTDDVAARLSRARRDSDAA